MFFYHQCPTVPPEAGVSTDGSGTNDSVQTPIMVPVLVEPPPESQTENVSSSVVY